jgi:hypothetical protein
MSLQRQSERINGDTGIIICSISQKIEDDRGVKKDRELLMTFSLRKRESGWFIESIQTEKAR